MTRSGLGLASMIFVVACSGAESASPTGAGGPATGGPPPTSSSTPGVDAGAPKTPESGAPASALAAIDAAIETARAARTPTPAVAFALYDRDDRVVYAKSYGSFLPSQRVAIASASKMVSGLVLLDLVGSGAGGLTLDSTTGAILGWAPPKANITLRHLLSFTSGIPQEARCTFDPSITLAECVAAIAAEAPMAAPGKIYAYGSTHLHVAARMAEVATGKSWATLFAETVRTPLGLAEDVAYFTFPKGSNGTTNPLIAGGLRSSMDEYAKILGAIFHKGLGVPESLYQAQTIEPFPEVTVVGSPANGIGVPFRYGLTAWLECSTPATGCATISSPGTYGFTPWLDRDTGYYAILGMELEEGGSGKFSVPVQQALKPLIPAALGRP